MLPRARAALTAAFVVIAVGVSVSTGAAPAPAAHPSGTAVTALPALDVQIAAAINTARAQRGLSRLHGSMLLRAAATFHSYDMVRHGFFSHASSDGTSPDARLARFYPSVGHGHRAIGEVLLWYDGSVDAATAVHEWLTSGEHRAVLLDAGFREVGISAIYTTSFEGNAATLVTADLGARSG